MKRLIPLILAIIAFSASGAAIKNRNHLLDSIRTELAAATNVKDSIRLVYDIYDLSPRETKRQAAEGLYELGVRAGDVPTQLEMLRALANIYVYDDSLRFMLQKKAESMSPSSEQRMTVLCISLINSVRAARRAWLPENMERLEELVNKSRQEGGVSVYTRLEEVFTICAYLEGKADNGLLRKYLAESETYLERLSNRMPALDIFYLAQTSLDYAAVGDKKRSVETDIRLLSVLDSMAAKYALAGREFRNFDYDRYSAYRRLLYNYEVLTPEQVDFYYEKAREASAKDDEMLFDYDRMQRPTIYYLLSKKRYAEAIPLIMNYLNEDLEMSFTVRLNMVNSLIKAAEAENNMSVLRKAYEMYRDIREDTANYHDQEIFTDMQFVYETNTLNLERSKLAVNKQRADLELKKRTQRFDRILIAAILFVVLILLGVIIFMSRTRARMKRLNLQSAKDNAALIEERDTLQRIQADMDRASEKARHAERQREEFIDNISSEIQTPVNAIVEYSQLIVDCIDDDRYRYLDRFASVVTLNAELLSSIVNDVLSLASHDKGSYKIEIKPVSVHEISTVATDTVKHILPEGVELVDRIATEPNVLIDTDAKRAAQVIIHLLGNAAKFTTEGSIVLDGKVSDDRQSYTFSVTDTGIGIPAGREEEIFERFKKLNKHTQGVGLGLPVSRMIAELLGGELKVDTTYEGHGARFIFTVPLRSKPKEQKD